MANENLVQTKAKFKVIGVVSRIDKDGAYREDVGRQGTKNEGKTYRSLRFGVKTSDTNEITVQMFGFEPEEVNLWNSEDAKKAKEQKKKYKGEKVDFQDWLENQDKYREDGYAILESRVGLTKDSKGKTESRGLPRYVAIEEIYNNLDNGDSVVVEGSISYSSYENRDGKTVQQKNFNIEKIFKIKDVDFESDKFEEVTYFEQEFVFVDAMAERKEKKIYITGRHINYNKTFNDIELVVDYSDGDGGNDPDMVKLADSFVKRFKFGDVLEVHGDLLNRAVLQEVEDDESTEEEDLINSLGGKSKPKHAQGYALTQYISEMQIHGVDAWDKKVYKEDDFKVEELLDKNEESSEDNNKLQDELGGKPKKSKSENPFDLDDDGIDISDDDLPF